MSTANWRICKALFFADVMITKQAAIPEQQF